MPECALACCAWTVHAMPEVKPAHCLPLPPTPTQHEEEQSLPASPADTWMSSSASSLRGVPARSPHVISGDSSGPGVNEGVAMTS